MALSTALSESGRYDIIIEQPPVNAFSIGLLRDLTEALRSLPDQARVVVLSSRGRGFCGGGDVKEVQSLPGFEGILGHGRYSLETCVAIEQCPVPVIAAVHRYCIGIGVLLAGVCDIIVATEGCQFVLAEADNGAASGVIQALGLLPDKRMRAAIFTCEPFTAEEMHRYGSVYAVTSPGDLLTSAHQLADTIAAKRPAVIRALKRSMNLSAGRDLMTKYRAELSYTYELNMTGDASAARATFVEGTREGYVPSDGPTARGGQTARDGS
jgi:enoyl-CoA hydratase